MQASLRCASGTRATACGLIAVSRHQHGVSKLPLRAGAQALEPPQSGHIPVNFGLVEGTMQLSVGMSRWYGYGYLPLGQGDGLVIYFEIDKAVGSRGVGKLEMCHGAADIKEAFFSVHILMAAKT